ncbi:2-dehydro-3-deoxygalactonokinase [Cellulosilyticum sp. I15G10I2]|uniref:2-dehydro-3-deoxygalactonokinase n=1 Tax=Cellulosilyticum sp. I15G10I2 TaxID=1892843 RepID=UPI00085CDD91|nr:2-dehydro-3-deoxygalactonokinase [Cellulosilyticum sp. I15G10I2]
MIAITVDVGTTNSRIKVIEGRQILSTASTKVGIKDVAITGSQDILESGLAKIIFEGLEKAGRQISDVEYFAASGMITCNLGLMELPYRISPVSMNDLINGIEKKEFTWLENKPFYFIPGVKNAVDLPSMETLSQIDVMRGEEVEAFGIIELCNIKGPALMILPGSHTKFVWINEANEIEKCSTTMLGEFLHALVNATILSSSILPSLITEIDEESVKKGIAFELENGVTKSAFAVRLMDIQLDTTPNERANFLAGALICNDINPNIISDIQNKYHHIYIGGSSPLKDIFKVVLEAKGISETDITVLTDDITDRAASTGALKMVENLRTAYKKQVI